MYRWARNNWSGKEYREWREAVLEICGKKCKNCGKNENLHCHHIVPWEKDESLRYKVENGEVYCSSCHLKHEREINPIRYWKGKRFSEEHRKNLSLSHIGKSPCNKGVKVSAEIRKKISETKKSQSTPVKNDLICKRCKESKVVNEYNFMFTNGRPQLKCRNCLNELRRMKRGLCNK